MKPGPARYENSKEGIRALVKRLGRERVALAVYEPTGGYERQLEGELREGGISSEQGAGVRTCAGRNRRRVLALYGEVFLGRRASGSLVRPAAEPAGAGIQKGGGRGVNHGPHERDRTTGSGIRKRWKRAGG